MSCIYIKNIPQKKEKEIYFSLVHLNTCVRPTDPVRGPVRQLFFELRRKSNQIYIYILK